MTQSLLTHFATSGPVIPLLLVFTLIAGGVSLIIYTSHKRDQDIGRRVEIVRSSLRTPGRTAARNALPDDYPFKPSAQGFSIQEQQQIARIFLKLGVPAEHAVTYFTIFRLAFVALAGGLVIAEFSSASPILPIMGALIAAIVAWFLPAMPIKMQAKRYRTEVGQALPDALELLAICVDAGISLEGGLARLGEELKESQPALAGELRLTWAEMSLLPSLDQALANMAERVGLPGVRTVVSTLSQSIRFGTPLTRSLRQAAAEMRDEQLLKLEERANRLPALLTVPVMLLIMPTIFLIVGGPAVLRLMDIFGGGAMSP